MQVCTWTVLLGLSALLVVTVLVPKLNGASSYTVLTSSMEPDLPAGALVVVRPVDPRDIGVGSVVTYQLETGEPEVVTHRVVSQGIGDGGEPVYQMQGDANEDPDASWVRPVQLRGELWYAVPHVGHLNSILSPDVRRIARVGVALALFGYAAVLLGAAARDRVRGQQEPAGPVDAAAGHG